MGHAHFDFKCWHGFFFCLEGENVPFTLYLANTAGICFKQEIYFSLPTVNFCICCCGKIGGRQGGQLPLNIVFTTFQLFIHKIIIFLAQALAFSEKDNAFKCTKPYIVPDLLFVLQLTFTMWRPYCLLERIFLCHAAIVKKCQS